MQVEHDDWCLRAKVWSVHGQLRVTFAHSRSWNCPACVYNRVDDLLEHLDEVIQADTVWFGRLDARAHAAARKQAQRCGAGWVTATPIDATRPRLILTDVDACPRGGGLEAESRAGGRIRLAVSLRQGGFRRVRAYGTWEAPKQRRVANPDWECLGTASPSSVDDKLAKAGIVTRWARLHSEDEDRLRRIFEPDRGKYDAWGRPITPNTPIDKTHGVS